MNGDDYGTPMDMHDSGAGPEPIGDAPAPYEPADAAPAPTPTRDEVRQQLVRQFEQWVDRMLEGEPLPDGLPDEVRSVAEELAAGEADFARQGCDLFTLFSAMTALSGEVGLQGRAFKQLTEALTPLSAVPDRLDRLGMAQLEAADRINELIGQLQQEEGPGTMPSSKEVLNVVFDLYDRLERGLRTLDAGTEALRSGAGGGWLARLSGAASRLQQAITATEGMRDAQRLMLSRLEAALHQWGIERIGEMGDLFDPRIMTAVEVQPSDQPEGTILEIYRSGYILHGEILATAQVKVAK